MPARTPPSARGKLRPKLYRLRGVKIFAAGTVRGKTWTPADIRQMADNGNKYSHLIRPTVVVGHEEHQPLTHSLPSTTVQNTGEPAFGVVRNLRAEEDGGTTYLTADFTGVPGWLARLLAGRHYIDRSAEVYEEPPDGLEHVKGPILRRVSLLGGELPQIKNLGELPAPEVQGFSEGEAVVTAHGHRLRLCSCRPGQGCGKPLSIVKCREVPAPERKPVMVTPSVARAALERAGMGGIARSSSDAVVLHTYAEHRGFLRRFAEQELGTQTKAANPFPSAADTDPHLPPDYAATPASRQPGVSTSPTAAPTRSGRVEDVENLDTHEVPAGARGRADPEGAQVFQDDAEPVSPDELASALVDYGRDPDVVGSMSTDMMGEVLRCLLAAEQGGGEGEDVDDAVVNGYAELNRMPLMQRYRLSPQEFATGFKAYRSNHRRELASARPGQAAAGFLGMYKR
jgi:hypothetical protein